MLVLPSLWPETFGLNVFRAMAYGIPCLVSTNTAAEKYMTESNGCVFEQGNYIDMKKKAESVILLKPNKEAISNCDIYVKRLIEYYSSVFLNSL